VASLAAQVRMPFQTPQRSAAATCHVHSDPKTDLGASLAPVIQVGAPVIPVQPVIPNEQQQHIITGIGKAEVHKDPLPVCEFLK